MRTITSLLILSFFSFQSIAQVVNNDFQKLFDLYIMDKYKECYFQSLKRMEKDKYRTSPEPYLYAARASLKLLDNRHFIEENPNLLKYAIKYGTKYVKYKNKTENPEEYDLLYSQDIELLRYTGLDEAEYYYHESKFRKAAYFAKKVYKLAPNDPRNQLILGLAQLTRRNTREGEMNVKQALENLANEPRDKGEDLREKENELIFYLARASSIELMNMDRQEIVRNVLEDLKQVLSEKEQEKLEDEFLNTLSQG